MGERCVAADRDRLRRAALSRNVGIGHDLRPGRIGPVHQIQPGNHQ
jgi:hypothetical protein